MKLPIALGVALAGLTVAGASAQSSSRHVIMRHGGGSEITFDANHDGWITRAEASAAYERVFADLDTNHDGKLDDADRRRIEIHGDAAEMNVFSHESGGRREVRVITGDLDEATRARIEREVDEAMSRADVEIERAERLSERAERNAERAERAAERAEERAERRTRHLSSERRRAPRRHHSHHWRRRRMDLARRRDDRHRAGGACAAGPSVPPPRGPFMMLIANSEEADLNGDGALSLEEFRNQHLRFFDASDANGDGRVRFEEPPAPPAPPAAPTPPEPPRRR